nr:MAG TPA: hypothetical protein [Caudoviricetes sp.]
MKYHSLSLGIKSSGNQRIWMILVIMRNNS